MTPSRVPRGTQDGPVERTSILLDAADPVPLWAQLAAHLRRGLSVGRYDERFPTEAELVETFGVSRHTVREAVRRLRSEGLLRARQGLGTFVIRRRLDQPLCGTYSLAHAIEALGLSERSEVLRCERGSASASAGALALHADDAVVRLERLRYAGDEPISLDRSVLALDDDDSAAFIGADLRRGSVYDVLAEVCGITVDAGTERVRPRMPSNDDKRVLDLAAEEAVLEVERVAFANGRPIEWRRSTVRGDCYGFSTSWGVLPVGDAVDDLTLAGPARQGHSVERVRRPSRSG